MFWQFLRQAASSRLVRSAGGRLVSETLTAARAGLAIMITTGHHGLMRLR